MNEGFLSLQFTTVDFARYFCSFNDLKFWQCPLKCTHIIEDAPPLKKSKKVEFRNLPMKKFNEVNVITVIFVGISISVYQFMLIFIK